MIKYNWTRQETRDLITLYEINECLWNKHLREYKDRDERVSSIQSISDEMKISIEEINKKIHNLRNQYRFELNKTKKRVPGKPKYTTKWPYFQNLSFLENIVSVRGSNSSQNNSAGDFNNETSEYTVEKYEEENDNSSEKVNNNNNETTIVTASGNAQPQQIFHVSVEYEEPKPKIKSEASDNVRKRRLVQKEAVEITQQHLLNQYVNHLQPSSSTPKQTPTIIIDDKSQDVEIKSSEPEEPLNKKARLDDQKQSDKFDIFGLFVASELRNLKNHSLQKKLKRKILECVMEMNDQDSDQQN